MKQIIHIYGASGSGTSTLGKKISESLGYQFMDTDDYFWMPTNPKFTTKREPKERIRLMKADIESAQNVVISGSLVDWGDELIPLFTLVIRLVTDTQVRIERIKQRESERFGKRIELGGDMYGQHQAFLKWAAAYDTGDVEMRSKANHDQWQAHLVCRQLTLDGGINLEANLLSVQKAIAFETQISQVKQAISKLFEGEASGHDVWHSLRVYRNACRIANIEKCKWEVVALAALLHDVDDSKLFDTTDFKHARQIMNNVHISSSIQEEVIQAIAAVSFKGKDTKTPETIEGKIVQDADRLDAIGAIGIARTFAFGGSRGRKMYDPNLLPKLDLSESEYKKHEGTTVNHFYEKLFLLKDLMNTKAARQMAEKRDDFMKRFLEEFYEEWGDTLR